MASETVLPPASVWQQWIDDRGHNVRALALRGWAVARRDWDSERLWTFGLATTVLALLLVLAFHLNRPLPFMPYHDAYEYVDAADRIVDGGAWLDGVRLPGYPLLLAGVFLVFGKDNLVAADLVQQLLFVVAAVEVYALAYRVWRDARVALAIGGLFATNFYFFSYVKPILSDGMALALTLALALLALSFIERPALRRFWPLTACMLALILTRGEWLLFPAPLFAVLVWSARGRMRMRRLLPHIALGAALLYGVVAGCVLVNARANGYAGLTDAQEINLFGKVTQYHMQDLAAPQYAALAHLSDWYVAQNRVDPWYIYRAQPWLGADHFKLLGAYARNVVLHHPMQFVLKSVPMAFRTLYQYAPFEPLNPAGREAGLLNALQQFSVVVYPLFMLFPFVAAGWALALVLWRSARLRQRAVYVSLVAGIAFYDLVMTTLGSYGEYTRLHLSFDPLMLVVVVGTLMLLGGMRRGARANVDGHATTTPQAEPEAEAEPEAATQPAPAGAR